ncbi:MAG TPA: isocitrate/isopropylmalate family dehydrogenase [Candidatus Bathyarchaeia archaeon]|nr:isocitrate/isopropylmalate family dehydrogenase [Candidatus Bathyarchaeia archaeon]
MPKKTYKICLMRGDGVGPEIFDATMLVLNTVCDRFKIVLDYIDVLAGDLALRKLGVALPKSSLEAFATSDACLKGPVGETVMDINVALRFGFDLYANLRPARSYPSICPPALRPDIDIVVIRENSEGFYRALENQVEPGVWTSAGVFTEKGAKRLANFAFNYAMKRRTSKTGNRKLVLATKANIFRNTHGMYLKIFEETAPLYPNVTFQHLYADALCARLVRDPENFDVIASENLIADLLSDLVGQVAGGLGMTPGTNINYETKHAYFEPTHGCAPDIAGKGIANPIGQIRAAALMLDYLGTTYEDPKLNEASACIESAIDKLLASEHARLPIEVGGQANTADVGKSIASMTAV